MSSTSSSAASSSSSSSGGGSGLGSFGNSGGYPNGAAYFQTVVISLVALALLLMVSVVFLYYRRRRLRIYTSSEWPFPSAFDANGRPTGRGGRRRKDEVDHGAKPLMHEVVMDERDGVDKEGWLTGCQPVAITSTHFSNPGSHKTVNTPSQELSGPYFPTTTGYVGAFPPAQQPRQVESQSSTLMGRFGRHLPGRAGRNEAPAAPGDVPALAEKSVNSTVGPTTARSAPSGPMHVPLQLAYLVAMPRNPAAQAARPGGCGDDEEDIPEVMLGTTAVSVAVDGEHRAKEEEPSAIDLKGIFGSNVAAANA